MDIKVESMNSVASKSASSFDVYEGEGMGDEEIKI